jgi:hypothetical protein
MQRMPLPQAAELLNIPPQTLRWGLQQGRFAEFGEAVKCRRKWSYYINRQKLYQYLGMEVTL